MATGLGGGQPKMPTPFPGQAEWDGSAVHSSKHTTGGDWKGKRALVVGACTSAHDVSQMLLLRHDTGTTCLHLQRSQSISLKMVWT